MSLVRECSDWGLIASMPACFVIYYKHARYGKRVGRVLVEPGRPRCSGRVTPTYECITDKEYETTKAIFYVRCGEITTKGWRGIQRGDVYRPHRRHAGRSVAFVHPKRSFSFLDDFLRSFILLCDILFKVLLLWRAVHFFPGPLCCFSYPFRVHVECRLGTSVEFV